MLWLGSMQIPIVCPHIDSLRKLEDMRLQNYRSFSVRVFSILTIVRFRSAIVELFILRAFRVFEFHQHEYPKKLNRRGMTSLFGKYRLRSIVIHEHYMNTNIGNFRCLRRLSGCEVLQSRSGCYPGDSWRYQHLLEPSKNGQCYKSNETI